MKDKKRNPYIELWRFFAGMCIAVYHFEWIYIGNPVLFQHFYVWVEFFFIISGFFLALTASKAGDKTDFAWGYVKKQFVKLFPLYLAAFVFSAMVSFYTQRESFQGVIAELWNAKWEILLMQASGFANGSRTFNLGGAPAYVSVLLICSLPLFYLIQNHRQLFINVIGPVCVVGCYCRIINQYGNLSQWFAFDGFFDVGLLRGAAGMSLGALAALAGVPYLKKAGAVIRGALGMFIIPAVVILLLVVFRNHLNFNDMLFVVLIFAFWIPDLHTIEFDLKDSISNLMLFLGKMSYPIFLFHYGVLLMLKHFGPVYRYRYSICIYLAVIIMIGCGGVFLNSLITRMRFGADR